MSVKTPSAWGDVVEWLGELWDLHLELIFIVVFIGCLAGSIVFVAMHAPSEASQCSKTCVAMLGKRIAETSYGCVCEGSDGKRFMLPVQR